MQSFPLYDELKGQITEQQQALSIQSLCLTITNLGQDHGEIIFALIHHHSLLEEQGSFKTIPYGGQIPKGGINLVQFNPAVLPGDLKLIIAKYLEKISQDTK